MEGHYHTQEGTILIEIKLTEIMRLFDPPDPFPLYEKALDKNAEEFILESVEGFPLKLVIYLPENIAHGEGARRLSTAIKNHFTYKSSVEAHVLKQLFRRGRMSLAIGLAFLFLCLSLNQGLAVSWDALPITTFREGFFNHRHGRDVGTSQYLSLFPVALDKGAENIR